MVQVLAREFNDVVCVFLLDIGQAVLVGMRAVIADDTMRSGGLVANC
jgi:hypothetical protein